MPRHISLAAMVVVLAGVCCAPTSHAGNFGVQGGLSGSGLTFRPDDPLFDRALKYRPAWSGGVQWVVPVASLDLETGVRYVEYGDRLDSQFQGTGPTYTFRLHQVWKYLAVPALIRVRPVRTRGLFVSMGPEVGYLVNVWHRETASIQDTGGSPSLSPARPLHEPSPAAAIFEDVGTFDSLTRYYRRWNLSACGSIGFGFPVGHHIGEAQLRYTHGLTDIAKSSTLARETRGLELLTGMRW